MATGEAPSREAQRSFGSRSPVAGDHHIERCDACALALYLFLVTVGDAKKLSYDFDATFARRWSMNPSRLAKTRQELIGAGLIAMSDRISQVLALGPRGDSREAGLRELRTLRRRLGEQAPLITYETFCQIKDHHERRD